MFVPDQNADNLQVGIQTPSHGEETLGRCSIRPGLHIAARRPPHRNSSSAICVLFTFLFFRKPGAPHGSPKPSAPWALVGSMVEAFESSDWLVGFGPW